jgi:transcriptional regulator with XRE-family HTH domain
MSTKKRPGRREPAKSGPELLALWREGLGLNQSKACAVVGLDPATYNAFEKGRRSPGMKRAARIEHGTGGAVPIAAWAPKRAA